MLNYKSVKYTFNTLNYVHETVVWIKFEDLELSVFDLSEKLYQVC